MKKTLWMLKNIWLLMVVCFRLCIYCVFHPKKIFSLCFSLYSSINSFYQVAFSQLENFEETEFFSKIKENQIFSNCNIINSDEKVTHQGEMIVLSSIVQAINPKTVFEIGTYNGFTSLHFAKNTEEDAKIFTLDLPEDFQIKGKDASKYSYDDLLVVKLSKENIKNRMFKQHKEKYKIQELFGDSLSFDYSPYYGKMDIVFIDGNHSYPYVKSDTENAMKMLTENGFVVWHDFDYIVHRDIFKYLNGLSQQYKIYSVPNTRFAIYGRSLK